MDWIISTCPWKDRPNFESSALQRIRPEDVGCDNMAAAAAVTSSGNSVMQSSSVEPSDPLVSLPANFSFIVQ